MNLENLLGNGYFPKELPPPFNTKDLSTKYLKIKSSLSCTSVKDPTRCINYSIAKVGLIRKVIKIPNPIHQCKLSEVIVNNWPFIHEFYNSSVISVSKPILSGSRAANVIKYKEFCKKAFLLSYPYSYELKTDISQYYPSIYTHSIPWAIHGKVTAKAKRLEKDLLGNILDKLVQQTMYGQTIGIPIGPDTSYIIQELIGCSIDKMMTEAIPHLKGYRYIDDMHFFFHHYDEAESALLKLQQILRVFELQVNTQKTKIQKLPKGIEQDWVLQLRSFIIRETEITQYNDIISFFSLAFDLANHLINEYVLSYAIEKVKRIKILSDNNFSLLETMLLKTLIAEPSTIKEVFRILFTYSEKVNIIKIQGVILNIIKVSSIRGYDYELSWGLWIAKTFKIKIPKEITQILCKIEDTISFIIVLDLAHSGQIDKDDLNMSTWEAKLECSSLRNENWLFAYEMGIKKWITGSFAYIYEDPYFKVLSKNEISFYNPSLQLSPININESEEIKKDIIIEHLKSNQTNKAKSGEVITNMEQWYEENQSEGPFEIEQNLFDELDIDFADY